MFSPLTPMPSTNAKVDPQKKLVAGATPRSRGLLDLPVASRTDWDTVQKVYFALAEHDEGIFRSSAILCDAFLRDDRISGVLATRINALTGLPMELAEADAEGQPAEIARELKEGWNEFFPLDQLAEILRWGITLNAGVGQLTWELQEDRWRPRLKHWHPQYLQWRWSTRSYWVSTMEDGMVEVTPGDGTWVLYTPHGFQRGWIHGAVRSLAVLWLIRRWAFRDWGRYSEVHGLPIKKATVPSAVEEKLKERFLNEVAALGTESAIRVEVDAEGKGFDFELVEAEGNTWEAFDKLITHCNDSIAIRLLGQNLTTEVRGGSLAAAKVQESVRGDVLKFDGKSLSTCLRKQVLKPWALYNFGDDQLAPAPPDLESFWLTDPPEDKVAKATTMKTVGDAVSALKAASANVDIEKVCERFDIPLMEGEPIKEPPAPEPAPGGFGGPAGGGQRVVKQKGTRPPSHVRGQVYVDELGDHAREDGRELLDVDLRAVLDVVEAADSYEQLREGLVKAFGKMDPKKLAKLVEKAVVLAELRGRNSVLEGL